MEYGRSTRSRDFRAVLPFTRKYTKTKFEGVFFRQSAKRDPRTGEYDKIYCFWYAEHEGKGHWKTVGRHSKGVPRPRSERSGQSSLPSLRVLASTPLSGIKSPSGTWWISILNGAGEESTLTSTTANITPTSRTKFTLYPLSSCPRICSPVSRRSS